MTARALTDELILTAMAARPGGIMTYVIRNILSMEHGINVPTSKVRRRLQRLELCCEVRRVASSYATQICWALPDPSKCKVPCILDEDIPF